VGPGEYGGLFGTKSTFVPLAEATSAGDDVQVPYEKQLIKDAPRMDPDGHLSEAEEQELWRHYGLDYGAGYTGTAAQARGTEDVDLPAGVGGREAGDDRTDRASDEAMTRSEEELRVGTQARERGRVRLRKYVTPSRSSRRFRFSVRRSGSSASRSPTPTSTRP
jgi:hypothetical protein